MLGRHRAQPACDHGAAAPSAVAARPPPHPHAHGAVGIPCRAKIRAECCAGVAGPLHSIGKHWLSCAGGQGDQICGGLNKLNVVLECLNLYTSLASACQGSNYWLGFGFGPRYSTQRSACAHLFTQPPHFHASPLAPRPWPRLPQMFLLSGSDDAAVRHAGEQAGAGGTGSLVAVPRLTVLAAKALHNKLAASLDTVQQQLQVSCWRGRGGGGRGQGGGPYVY